MVFFPIKALYLEHHHHILLSITVTSTMTKCNSRRKGLILSCSLSGQELQAGMEAKATEECFIPGCFPWLAQLGFLCTPRSGVTLPIVVWVLLCPLLIKKMPLKICLQANLMKTISPLKFLLPRHQKI